MCWLQVTFSTNPEAFSVYEQTFEEKGEKHQKLQECYESHKKINWNKVISTNNQLIWFSMQFIKRRPINFFHDLFEINHFTLNNYNFSRNSIIRHKKFHLLISQFDAITVTGWVWIKFLLKLTKWTQTESTCTYIFYQI